MNMSVREAKARFAEAANLAAGGERVVITKHGKPFVELVPAAPKDHVTWERFLEIRKELGIEDGDASWFDEFISNPEASRRVLGLDD